LSYETHHEYPLNDALLFTVLSELSLASPSLAKSTPALVLNNHIDIFVITKDVIVHRTN
jgi:hypothetical protein